MNSKNLNVQTTASLIKRWMLGTFQGSCSKEHFAYYLDEFVFRYNKRKSKRRGLLFYRSLENAALLILLHIAALSMVIRES